MSKKIKKNIAVVKTLHKSLCKGKDEEFKDILNCLNDDCINFLCECVRNVCDIDVFKNLPRRSRKNIERTTTPHKKNIKKIIKSKTSIRRKRKLIQHGSGWFLPLLTAVIPMITSLFSK